MAEPDATASQVVVLPGHIDVTNAERVAVQLMAAVGGDARVVVADLGATGFCDSAGVQVLVQVSRRANARDVEVRLAAAREPVLRILELMGVTRLLRLYTSVPEALAGEGVPGA
ncbi:MAG: STAS domain-containing protein [Streptosporangiaceae bacterium]|nr:STAS domain-containing protein [Streptosporangiaceae bacterium]MBV9856534.1 STAS domain-containing protein [Streptosporangiaceae bacterium]